MSGRSVVRHLRSLSAVTYSPAGGSFKYGAYSPPAPASGQVSLKVMGATVNDIDLAPGAAGAFAGTEGVAVVEAVGSGVSGMAVGDWVVPTIRGVGMWRSALTCPADAVRKVPNTVSAPSAALLGLCLPTALALSQYFRDLKAGDIIVQNCASGTIGMLLVQLAARQGIQTINITGSRSQREDNKMREFIKMLGGTAAVTTEFLSAEGCAKRLVGSDSVMLGFNGAGGEDALAVAALLSPEGTMVTYGSKSGKPLQFPSDAIASMMLTFETFDVELYLASLSAEDKAAFYGALNDLVESEGIKAPMEEHAFGEGFEAAIARSQERSTGRKVFFKMA